MLRITVELIPLGEESKKKKIGEMVVANTGRNPDGTNSYSAWTAADQHSGESARFGRLGAFDRSQSLWELIRLLLECIRLENHKPTPGDKKLFERLLFK